MERTLLEQVQEYIKQNGKLNLPFYRIQNAVNIVVEDSNMFNGKPDYTWVELIKVIACTMQVLAEMGIKYKIPEFEKESEEETATYDYYSAYDELKPIYDELFYITDMSLIEDLIERELGLAKNSWIKRGQFEGQLLDIAEKFIEKLGNLSDLVNDKKKFSSLLKTMNKELPNLKDLIK